MENEIAEHESVALSQINGSSDYLQMMPIAQAQKWYLDFAAFTKSILKKDLDYGEIPGTQKPSLYKAGAEKLRFVYGLGIEFDNLDKIIQQGDSPFVSFTYRCTVRNKNGNIISQCEGNCNSAEPKFGYIWVSEPEVPDSLDKSKLKSRSQGKKLSEFDFAITKAETGGQYGKPQSYWDMWKKAIEDGKAKKQMKKTKTGKEMEAWELNDQVTVYRITNPEVVGQMNTIMKMAQKRAFVGAILVATGASEYFTQDVEDLEINGQVYSDAVIVDAEVIHEEKKPAQPRQQTITDQYTQSEPEKPRLTFKDAVIPFGNHKGTKYMDLPVDYLQWLAKDGKSPQAKKFAQEVLDNMDNHDEPIFPEDVPFEEVPQVISDMVRERLATIEKWPLFVEYVRSLTHLKDNTEFQELVRKEAERFPKEEKTHSKKK